MKQGTYFHMVGINCAPELDEKFNKWYNETHVPMLMKFKGMKEAARYRITKETDEYPKYLATYLFDSKSVYETYKNSPEYAAGQAQIKEFWKDPKLDVLWRVQYEVLKVWQPSDRKPRAATKSVMLIRSTNCHPDDEEKLNKWYDRVHVPMLLRFEGMIDATRYKIVNDIGEFPKYLATYTFESLPAFEAYEKSPELAAAKAELNESWKDRKFESIWRVTYEVIKTWKR